MPNLKNVTTIIGQACREARASRNMTRGDLCQYVGVTSEFYDRVERGSSIPSLLTFLRIAAVLRLSVDDLLEEIIRSHSADLFPHQGDLPHQGDPAS